jgi:hypothetical protein
LRAFLGEQVSDTLADAAARAGDPGDLILKTLAHLFISP